MNSRNPLSSDDIDIATLNLSGEQIIVGYTNTKEDRDVFLQVSHLEPIYFSTVEAEMLIASLAAAIERCRGKE